MYLNIVFKYNVLKYMTLKKVNTLLRCYRFHSYTEVLYAAQVLTEPVTTYIIGNCIPLLLYPLHSIRPQGPYIWL